LRAVVRFALGLLLTTAGPLRSQEAGLLELRLDGAEPRVVTVLLAEDGTPLVPLRATADFLAIPLELDGDTLALYWPPATWDTRLHLPGRAVLTQGTRHVAGADEWVWHDGELFLSLHWLNRVLGVEARLDFENLALVLGGRPDFPRTLMDRHAARRAADSRSGAARTPDVDYPARSGGGAAGWYLSGTSDGRTTRVAGRAQMGVALLGGALETGVAGPLGDDASLDDVYGHLARAFPHGQVVRQLELGDVRRAGVAGRPYFGAAITNEPLYLHEDFGEVQVRPAVPAGWEYEVYEGNRLLGVSTDGAQAPVPATVRYGITPLRVRMIGPAGQERVEDIVFLVSPMQVPAGAWRYQAGAGACRTAACTGTGHADLRLGLSHALTVGMGLDLAVGDTIATTRPTAMAVLNARPNVRFDVQARAGSLVHGTLQHYSPRAGWRLSGGWRQPEGDAKAVASHFADGSGSFRMGRTGRGGLVQVHGLLRSTRPAATNQWQAGVVIADVAPVHLGVAWESGLQQRDVLTLQARALPSRRHLPAMLGDLNVSGRVHLVGGGLHGAGLAADFRPTERASVSAAAGWHGERRPPSILLAIMLRTSSAYVQAGTHTTGQGAAGHLAAGGGLALGAGQVVLDPLGTLGRGGVRGVAFMDVDGDGVRDSHEPVLPGVPVRIGGERVTTDGRGAFHAWGLLPYAVTAVTIDTLALTTTDLSPLRPNTPVRVPPNAYARVDIALVRTREVMGSAEWRDTGRRTGGITVEAVPDGPGPPQRAVTFSDGAFYFPRLPAGPYTLRVAESSLRLLNAEAEATIAFSVPGDAGTGLISVAPLVLRPRHER
jgi:hypothetical protein